MSRAANKPSVPVRPSVLPPLQSGDRMTRDEFERRFDATPGLKKAELIEGIVYVPPPVSHSYHSEPNTELILWLTTYRAHTPGIRSGTNGSLRLDLKNMPQPDGYLLIDPARGGQAKIDEDGYVVGAPELVAEVAASTASYDMHLKRDVYRRNGVREYVVWRTYENAIDYLVQRQDEVQQIEPDEKGIIRSIVFPGLWLVPQALLAGDLAGVLRVVQEGISSPEHQAFVQRLVQP